jgi:hypothetical protein
MPHPDPTPTPWAHAGTVAQWHSRRSRRRFALSMPRPSHRERRSPPQMPAVGHVPVRRSAYWKGKARETDTASCAGTAQYSRGRLCTGSLAGGYLIPMVRNVKDMLPDHDQLARMEEALTMDA